MRDPVVQLDLPVVRLDLGGEHVEAEAEASMNARDSAGQSTSGSAARCADQGARRARELGEVLGRLDLRGDALEAPREDRELLAHRRRRRGLSVGAGEHRRIAVRDREFAERRDDRAQLRQPHLVDGALDGEGVGEVVDVLAGAREVGELGDRVQARASASRSRTRYSTAFTSWRVIASSSASSSISAWPKSADERPQRRALLGVVERASSRTAQRSVRRDAATRPRPARGRGSARPRRGSRRAARRRRGSGRRAG